MFPGFSIEDLAVRPDLVFDPWRHGKVVEYSDRSEALLIFVPIIEGRNGKLNPLLLRGMKNFRNREIAREFSIPYAWRGIQSYALQVDEARQFRRRPVSSSSDLPGPLTGQPSRARVPLPAPTEMPP